LEQTSNLTDYQRERLEQVAIELLKQYEFDVKVIVQSISPVVLELMHEAYKMGWQEGH
jgi:hypothetical protein